jgi:predicted nucleic acid-binding protein
MIVPDVNLILYAYDQDGPFHRESADWWSRCLNGSEAVGLAPVMTDAQIGALALRYRATVHTADTDFTRLRDVLWRNPLTGQHGPR